MKKSIIIIFTLFITLNVFAKSGKIVLKGQVQNHEVPTIVISRIDNKKVISAELDNDGKFSMSVKIDHGYYLLQYGRSSVSIYLYPKDNLSLVFDAKNFESTLVFDGEGSERNNYLIKKELLEVDLTKDLEAFYKVDETGYLKNITNVKSILIALLYESNVEGFFKEEEEKSIEYSRLLSIQNYKNSYKFYLGDEITPSKDFYRPIETLKLDNDEEYTRQPYYRYLVNSVWSKRIDAEPDVESMLAVLRKVKNQELAISLVNGFYSKISSKKERAKDYLDLIKRVTKHQPFIEAAEKRYQEVMNSKGLKEGDVSPEFSYESIDGQIVSLSDLKGKYIYIDVWATWCGPCIKQVPYLIQLEERYHDKNIVFVSISVDKEDVKPAWKQMIADKGLGGLQLFADKSFDSDFMNAYAVNSIPRFILLDPEGKIIDPEAPRPSFEKTKVLLDKLLN